MSGDVTPESLRVLADERPFLSRPEGSRVLRAAANRITGLEAALAERDATIAAAPHGRGCPQGSALSSGVYPDTHAPDPCNCWKSAAPGDALTAHNAEVWEEGFRADPTGSYDGDIGAYGGNPYRAKAIQEGK